jgi:FkbM family methyltransferase
LLSESLGINGFRQVVLDRRAVSSRSGVAELSLSPNAELNELVRSPAAAGPSETVTLTSMDEAAREHGWIDIDFVKIDAEGEERAIIRGGTNFFRTQSPLIQYEIKAGAAFNIDLVEAFAEIGYASYRLVPGLGLLAPFDPRETLDGYLLNLFCCKPDRAAGLAAEGRLALPQDWQALAATGVVNEVVQGGQAATDYGWHKVLLQSPYGRLLANDWRQTVVRVHNVEIERALALHAVAHDERLPAEERFLALRISLELLMAVCNEQPDFLRLSSLARVAHEFGARQMAVLALENLYKSIVEKQRVDTHEPFLATDERFDTLDPKGEFGNWLVCSVLEALERLSTFSSLYTGDARLTRQRLESIRNLGFGSAEMARRLALIEQRFGGAGVA